MLCEASRGDSLEEAHETELSRRRVEVWSAAVGFERRRSNRAPSYARSTGPPDGGRRPEAPRAPPHYSETAVSPEAHGCTFSASSAEIVVEIRRRGQGCLGAGAGRGHCAVGRHLLAGYETRRLWFGIHRNPEGRDGLHHPGRNHRDLQSLLRSHLAKCQERGLATVRHLLLLETSLLIPGCTLYSKPDL